MKQNITVDQLNELSDKGGERLREWWKEEPGDITHYDKYLYPLLSIGRMIGFLNEHIKFSSVEWEGIRGYWFGLTIKNGKQRFYRKSNEICDSLWEAVKEVLEK